MSQALNTRSFAIAGQVSQFVIKDGYRLKAIELLVEGHRYRIKLPEDLQQTLPGLERGDRVQVMGWAKRKKTGIVKLTAEDLTVLKDGQPANNRMTPGSDGLSNAAVQQTTGKVLVCQKSGCMKRGGRAVRSALEQALRDRDLDNRVGIQATGCMNRCKAGPNLVFLPAKARYDCVAADKAAELVNHHFPSESVASPAG